MKQSFLTSERLSEILENIGSKTICTIGDMCLDFYVFADMKISSLSRETPHYPLPVVKEVATPGGGGNVVNNIKALRPGRLLPVSLIGNDWRGFMLTKYFETNGFDTRYIISADGFITNCYLKPMRMGISDVIYEDPRLDFENRAPISKENEKKLLRALDEAVEQADILIVSDQMKNGIITPAVRERISEIGEKIPVVIDSRDNSALFKNVIIKPNEVEAAVIAGRDLTGLDSTIDELATIGLELEKKNSRPVIITMGDRGALWCEKGEVTHAPTKKAEPPVDFVGAGDTFISAFGCAYAAGATGEEAIAFGNIASGVTVKKIGTTGTASPEEMMSGYSNCPV